MVPGPTTSDLNVMVSAAMFTPATFAQQAIELFGYSGIIQPSHSQHFDMYSKTKAAISGLGPEQLCANHIKHVAVCRAQPGYKGDIVWHDNNGVSHSVARGPIGGDGSGDKRAYRHKISGNQHCIALFSLVTADCLYLGHDQISCYKCY